MIFYSSFLVAMFAAIIMIPPLTYVYQKLGILDMPSPRKVHSKPVPRVGGIAIVIASVIPMLIWMTVDIKLVGVLVGISLLFLLGIVDDVKNLDYKIKFLVQIITITLIFKFGFIDVAHAYYVSGNIVPAALLSIVYMFFILGVTNAINLADGLDGLAGGEALLSFSIIGLLAYESSNFMVLTIVLAIMGAIFGFLRFNTYPAKIFMGDTGSLFLGFLLGLLSVALTYSETNAYAKTLPLLLVGLPVFDTLMVIIVRLSKKQSPFSADRNHLHHRLLDNGLKHYQSVLVIYVVQGAYVLTAYFMRYQLDQAVVLAFIVISLLTLVIGAIPWRWVLDNNFIGILNKKLAKNVIQWINCNSQLLFILLSLCLLTYAVTSFLIIDKIGRDILALLFGIALLSSVFLVILKNNPCNWVERISIHIMIVLSIYMGANYSGVDIDYISNMQILLIVVCFILIGLMLIGQQKFTGSPLDFLLVAVALIVPNLPGSPISDPELSYLALKLIALFYCVEFVLFNLTKQWWIVRTALVACAGIPILASFAS